MGGRGRQAGVRGPVVFSNPGGGDFETTGNVKNLYLTPDARGKIESAIQRVMTARDLEGYLADKGIDLIVDYAPLQQDMDQEIPSVKQQIDYIIAATEQYEAIGGLSALKAVHMYDPDLGPQGMYSYRANGEGPVADEGHLYLSDRANGYHVMHEFAHAYADSTKPPNMDVVEWSARLNQQAQLPTGQGTYIGSNSDVQAAEQFATAVGAAITYGRAGQLGFLQRVAQINTRK